MNAVTFTEASGPDAIETTELPDPTPGAGEVLIAVEASTINPVDLSALSGAFGDKLPGSAPRVLGWDLAGTVTAVGDGVEAELVGSRVLGFSQWFKSGVGGQASLVRLPRDNVAIAGDALASAELTTFGLNGLTALHVLDQAEVPDGGTVAVSGSSGGVGAFVVEFARDRGVTVHTIGRTTTDEELAAMNADSLVNSAPWNQSWLAAVKDGGSATSVTEAPEAERGIRVARVGVKPDRAGLELVLAKAESGVLGVRLAQTFPAAEAADAYRAFASGGSHGRVVITF